MAQKAIFFTTNGTGDGANAYTQAEMIRWLRTWFNLKPQDQGIFLDGGQTGSPGGELAITPGSGEVSVAAGVACVYGFPYFNDAAYAVAIPTPTGNTRIDRIVLRADWTAQTVRITRLPGTEGTGSPPSIIQTDGVTWDLKLAQVQVTTGGVITILSDERQFIHSGLRNGTENLDDQAVTAAKLAAAIAGNGLSGGAGSALAVNVDGATIEINADALRVKDSGITAAKLAAAVAGDGLSGGGGSALAVNADGATIEINADTLRVKDGGITAAKLAAAVAGNGLSGGGGSALAVNADGTTIEINADTLRVKDGGITAAKIANRARTLFVQPGLSTASPNSYYSYIEGQGLPLRDAQSDSVLAAFQVPSDYVSGLIVSPIAWSENSGACSCRSRAKVRSVGESFINHELEQSTGTTQAMLGTMITKMRPWDISATVVAGDFVGFIFDRSGQAVEDTIGADVYVIGFLLEYTADS